MTLEEPQRHLFDIPEDVAYFNTSYNRRVMEYLLMTLEEPQRHLFDIPEDVAYFNTSYNAPQLKASSERLRVAASAKGRPWERGPDSFFEDAERVRTLAAEIFGGTPDCYAVVPAASYGTSTAARILEPLLGRGDEVLAVDEAFPSNFLPWQRMARESGASFVTVPTPADLDWTQAILSRIGKATRVVAAPPCHWTNGARIDLEAVAGAAREVGAFLAVDATQALGAAPLDLARIKPDFLIAAGYKWLLCPYGFSLFYVDPRWHEARALEESWITRANAKDFANLVRYTPDYRAGARRFDVGQTCTALLPGAVAALEQIKAWGVEAIAERLSAINAVIMERVAALGLRLPAEAHRSPNMFGATLPEGRAGPLVPALAEKKIFVSQRGNALRFSPHLQVSQHDLDRLLQELGALLS